MPPIDADSLRSMQIVNYDVDWLLTQLEGGRHTGCVKTNCASRSSRAAMLLYNGRVVGCIHSTESEPSKPTEESLELMLSDLDSQDTIVSLYDLPEEIVAPLSSLFLGFPVAREDDYNAKEYVDYICTWLQEKNGTATIAASFEHNGEMLLVYVNDGEFVGTFHVGEQVYDTERTFLNGLLEAEPLAKVEVSIVQREQTKAARFGFSLSSARSKLILKEGFE